MGEQSTNYGWQDGNLWLRSLIWLYYTIFGPN